MSSHGSAGYPSPQHLCRRKRVDQRTLANISDGNELVGPMRHGQQSRSVGERGNAASRIEECFEKAWTHLEGGFFPRDTRDVLPQNSAERIFCRSCRRGFVLKCLDVKSFERIVQPPRFFLQVLLWVDPAVDSEPEVSRRYVEIRASLAPATQQQNGFARRCRRDVVSRFPKLHFLLDLGKLADCRQGTLERVHTLELSADMRRLSAHRGTQRNRSTIGVPNDAARGLWRKHTNAVFTQDAARSQIARPTRTGGLFIRYQRNSDTPGFKKPFIACGYRSMNHRRQPAFHVR